jgi:HSP20 family protein
MLSLSRNLFDDLFSVHRELDDFFERTWGPFDRSLPAFAGKLTGFNPEVDCYNKDGNLVYRLAIPGVDPKNVDLTIADGQVTVKGERAEPAELKDEKWLIQEFRYGRFERSFNLPEGVDIDKVSATFNSGVLEITIPAGKAQLPRRIEIRQLAAGDPKVSQKASV